MLGLGTWNFMEIDYKHINKFWVEYLLYVANYKYRGNGKLSGLSLMQSKSAQLRIIMHRNGWLNTINLTQLIAAVSLEHFKGSRRHKFWKIVGK
jgi:hypothetical protein